MIDVKVQQAFDHFQILRGKNIDLIQSIPKDKMMTIPNGFSNNIYWHTGHILTVQHSLLYRRCNLELGLDSSYLDYFAKGLSPASFDDRIPEIDTLLKQLEHSIVALENNLDKYADKKYDDDVTVSFGFTLNSFNDAVIALPYHESYHLGSMNVLKKFLK